MGEGGKPDDARGSKAHFREKTFQAAMEAMSDQYGPNDHLKNGIREERTVRKFLIRSGIEEKGYGSYKPDSNGDEQFEIGQAGLIWAMMCLLPTNPRLQRVVGGHSKGWASYILGGSPSDDDTDRIFVILKNTTTRLESSDYSGLKIDQSQLDRIYKKVRELALKILRSKSDKAEHEGLSGRLDKILNASHRSPERCAEKIGIEFGFIERGSVDAPDAPATPFPSSAQSDLEPWHYFEPTLDEFMRVGDFTPERDRDDEINEAIDKIDQAFRIERKAIRPKIALLEGKEQSGKKSIVGDFLRRVRDETEQRLKREGQFVGRSDNPIVLQIPYSHGQVLTLPIFVVSLRDHDYCSLAAHVYAFLLRINDPQLRSEHNNAQDQARALEAHAHELKLIYGRGGSPDKLIELIKIEHEKRPALFGFLDAHGLDRDSLQRVLRHSGLYRLLVGLWDSNHDSRYLITTVKLDRRNAPTKLGLSRDAIKVPLPTFTRFAWCLRDAEQERYRADGPSGSMESLLLQFAQTKGNPKVHGDVLLVLSALYTLDPEPTSFIALTEKYISGRATKGTGPDRADAEVYDALVLSLAFHGVLLPMALIAATRVTEDVLSSTSLDVLTAKYFEQKKKDGAASIARMGPILDNLSEAVRKLFVAKTRYVHVDEEELGFDEAIDSAPFNWFMSTAVARGLLDAMLRNDAHAELARDALRLIATAARRRAQWKRIRRSEDASMEDRQDIARDIQAYVALLASLPPRVDGSLCEDGKRELQAASLYRSVDRIFTIRGNFERETAYRFAVLCLLRQHIDHNYRLSMVTDQDELRLRLYLLALLPVGKLYTLSVPELRKEKNLKDALPIDPAIPTILGSKVYLELLLTVALAAYHAQAPKIVEWAWREACDVDQDETLDDQTAAVLRARIACTVADAGISTGRHDIDTGNLAKVHCWITRQAQQLVDLMNGDPIKEDHVSSELLGKRELVKARMRIAAREAELSWIASVSEETRHEAARIYKRLEELEDQLADVNRQEAPIVLSGRTARRYARFQGNDFPLIAEPWFAAPVTSPATTEQKRKILFIIQTNILRLNEYAGADRIGVLLDQARRYCLRGKFDDAMNFVVEAERRLDYSRISHGGKMEVFVVRAGISTIVAEIAAGSGEIVDTDWQAASTTVKRLEEIAEELDLLPAQAFGRFLAARLAILQNSAAGSPLLSGDASHKLDKAIQFAEEAGHTLLDACAKRWRDAAQVNDAAHQ